MEEEEDQEVLSKLVEVVVEEEEAVEVYNIYPNQYRLVTETKTMIKDTIVTTKYNMFTPQTFTLTYYPMCFLLGATPVPPAPTASGCVCPPAPSPPPSPPPVPPPPPPSLPPVPPPPPPSPPPVPVPVPGCICPIVRRLPFEDVASNLAVDSTVIDDDTLSEFLKQAFPPTPQSEFTYAYSYTYTYR